MLNRPAKPLIIYYLHYFLRITFFGCFLHTVEVTGSNPVSPTTFLSAICAIERPGNEAPGFQNATRGFKGPGEGGVVQGSLDARTQRRRAAASELRSVIVLGMAPRAFDHHDRPMCVGFSPLSSCVSSIIESSSIGRRQLQLPQQFLKSGLFAQNGKDRPDTRINDIRIALFISLLQTIQSPLLVPGMDI